MNENVSGCFFSEHTVYSRVDAHITPYKMNCWHYMNCPPTAVDRSSNWSCRD